MSIFSRRLTFCPELFRRAGPTGRFSPDEKVVVVWSENADGSETIMDIMRMGFGEAEKLWSADGTERIGITWDRHMLELECELGDTWVVKSATPCKEG